MVCGLIQDEDVRWVPKHQRKGQPGLLAPRERPNRLDGEPSAQAKLGQVAPALLLGGHKPFHHDRRGGDLHFIAVVGEPFAVVLAEEAQPEVVMLADLPGQQALLTHQPRNQSALPAAVLPEDPYPAAQADIERDSGQDRRVRLGPADSHVVQLQNWSVVP
eukprot:scaffold243053_cov40-Prasinocladus_malaysianus.AAC.1